MTRLGRAGCTLLPLCIGLMSAGVSSAQESETVWLELPDCATPPYDSSELSRSLEIELAPYHLRAQARAAGGGEPGTSVQVGLPRCDADSRWLTLQFGDALGRRSRKRALSLRDVPRPARARMLALVIAYALRPGRATADEDAPPAAVRPVQAEPSRLEALAPVTADPVHVDTLDDLPIRNFPFPLQPAEEHAGTQDWLVPADARGSAAHEPLPDKFRLGAGAEWRLLDPRINLLLGVGLNLRGQLLGRSEWAIEGAFTAGNTGTQLVDWWKAGGGIDYPLLDAPCLRLGPRVGLASVTSVGDQGSTPARLTTVGGRASFSGRLGRRANLDVQFEVEESVHVKTVPAQDAPLPWYGPMLTWGIGLSFDI